MPNLDQKDNKKMKWTVIGERDGKIKLVSIGVTGILPKGSFLTVEDHDSKYI